MSTVVLVNPHRFALDPNSPLTVSNSNVGTTIGRVDFPLPAIASQRAVWVANDLALSDGAAVASWTDRVSGYNPSAAGTLQPLYRTTGINGRPAVDFDGSNDILAYTAANGIGGTTLGCAIVVMEMEVASSEYRILSSCDEASTVRYWTCGTVTGNQMTTANRNNDTADSLNGNDVMTTGIYCLEWSSSGTTTAMRRNNDPQTVSVTSGANNGDWIGDITARDNFTIGALKRTSTTNFFNGKIALIMVADAELSTDDRTTLYGWISDYYGITMG
jgi:hypothetical protein